MAAQALCGGVVSGLRDVQAMAYLDCVVAIAHIDEDSHAQYLIPISGERFRWTIQSSQQNLVQAGGVCKRRIHSGPVPLLPVRASTRLRGDSQLLVWRNIHQMGLLQ